MTHPFCIRRMWWRASFFGSSHSTCPAPTGQLQDDGWFLLCLASTPAVETTVNEADEAAGSIPLYKDLCGRHFGERIRNSSDAPHSCPHDIVTVTSSFHSFTNCHPPTRSATRLWTLPNITIEKNFFENDASLIHQYYGWQATSWLQPSRRTHKNHADSTQASFGSAKAFGV